MINVTIINVYSFNVILKLNFSNLSGKKFFLALQIQLKYELMKYRSWLIFSKYTKNLISF